MKFLLLGIMMVILAACTTTRTLSVSPDNPATRTEEAGMPCLRSTGANPVTLWLLTPRFRTDPDDLAPPAFRVLVKNGGAEAFAFSPANITASAGGTAVRVLTAVEFAREIDRQAVAMRQMADSNVAKAREKLDQFEAVANLALATPGTTPGTGVGPMYDFSTVRQSSTDQAREQLDANQKSRAAEIEAWRQNLLEGVQMMLGEHTVSPDEMAGGVVRLDPRAVAAGRTLKLVVTAGGEAHEFLFEVGR